MPPRPMPKIMYGTACTTGEPAIRTDDSAERTKRRSSWSRPFPAVLIRDRHPRGDVHPDQASISPPILAFGQLMRSRFTSIAGQDRSQPLPYDPHLPIPQQVEQSFEKSLSNLGLEYIDSVVLHSPLPTKEQTLAAYRTLEGLVNQGKVRYLGVSNIYDPEMLEWMIGEARLKLGVVQNRWYEGNGWDWDIHDICQANSIRYQSFWTLSGSPTLLRHPSVLSLAKQSSLTPEATVYKLCQLWSITPLCGSKTPANVAAALAVEGDEGLQVDAPEVKELLKLMRGE